MKGKKHLLSCTEFCHINTEGLSFCGAGRLLLLLLPGSWAPGRWVSGKLLKSPMREERKTIFVCEKSSNSWIPSIPISHIQRHCMLILTRRRIVWWNLKVEKNQLSWISSTACSDPIPDQRKLRKIWRHSKHILLYLNYLQILNVTVNITNCVLRKWLL